MHEVEVFFWSARTILPTLRLHIVEGKRRRARLSALDQLLVKALLALELIRPRQGILGTFDMHVAEVERLL